MPNAIRGHASPVILVPDIHPNTTTDSVDPALTSLSKYLEYTTPASPCHITYGTRMSACWFFGRFGMLAMTKYPETAISM
jgi:hypothetical protein